MYPIIYKKELAESIYWMDIRAPLIANRRKPGQFVVIRLDEEGERTPLTIAASDPAKGAITIIFQAVGQTTMKLEKMDAGDELADVVGPLGKPTHMENFGHAVCIGGGLGIALALPIVRGLKQAGNRVTSILSARSSNLLILQDEVGESSDEVKLATDDGSLGYHGFPTDLLKQMLESDEEVGVVFAVGPIPMMAAVASVTRPFGVKTIVSLNPIMVDGTGMCGGCRVTVGGKVRFVCVDGPEFDGYEVDFRELARRNRMYEGYTKEGMGEVPRRPPTKSDWHTVHTQLAQAEAEAGGKPHKMPRVKMLEQEPPARVRNFDEVPYGYTAEMAVAEARRCLQCKKPMCVTGCPVGIDIPAFIKLTAEGKFIEAARLIKQQNSLPAICGRVCPQETQCEMLCVLGKKGDPVGIGNLERFVADYERERGEVEIPELPPKKGLKVAVVGSGPAGLTASGELLKRGYDVTIFEALHKAGGVLVYGIPEFRLPKAIVKAEIDYLRQMGVETKTNAIVGKLLTVDELLDSGYSAVFIGSGAGLPIFARVPGENLNGVFSANEYLTRVNLMKAYRADYATPVYRASRVAVLGGGNVAMDSARTALRIGAEKVMIIYRRSVAEAPARVAERHHAEEEGIEFNWLTNAVEFIGNEDGWVKAIKCIRMELGEPDDSGRRRPIPIEGSEFVVDVDAIIVAYGNTPHPLVSQTTPDLKVDERGRIMVEEGTGMTSKEGVFAGGDIVTGAATVILAMGAGKQAAAAIDDYLRGRGDA